MGTVNLIRNCLGSRCVVLVSSDFAMGRFRVLDEAFRDRTRTLLLFPGKGSVSLREVLKDRAPPEEVVEEGKRGEGESGEPRGFRVVLVDGTWAQAKQILKRNPHLRDLRCVYLDYKQIGEYGQLRKEPRKYFLSTVESVAKILEILEPDSAVGQQVSDALMASFRGLVRLQLSFAPSLQAAEGENDDDPGYYTPREAMKRCPKPELPPGQFPARLWIFKRLEWSLNGTSSPVLLDMEPYFGTHEEARVAAKWLNTELKYQKGDKVSPVPFD